MNISERNDFRKRVNNCEYTILYVVNSKNINGNILLKLL